METLKTSIYSPKHTKNKKISVIIQKKNEFYICQTNVFEKSQRGMLNFIALLIFHVEGHTA